MNANENESTQSNQPHDANSSERHCPFESFCSALNEGAEKAKAAAKEAAPKLKSALSDAAYWMGYGVSFGAVFSYVVLKELTPQPMKDGASQGAEDARKRADEFFASLRRAPAEATSTAPPPSAPGAPSEPASEPGVA
ncbi:MAG: hypothetical protein AB1813_06945 [Verrucomicrobiota bacterium]